MHKDLIAKLADTESLKTIWNRQKEGFSMPSISKLTEIVELSRAILFPGYFGDAGVNHLNLPYHIGINIEHLSELLIKQIEAVLNLTNENNSTENKQKAKEITFHFLNEFPLLREILATDVIAAYNGDPAAKSYGEVIFCYPAIRAIINYRIAHTLFKLNVPLIPRIITEMAHSETGIDIHPGATIGRYFTIDHGTGVVIGETAIIGEHVQLYQGVTLGSRSFPLDENGNPIKGQLRHPIIEDNVIVYSNASILGRVTIGKGSIIGGNIWIEHDVPAGSIITQKTQAKK